MIIGHGDIASVLPQRDDLLFFASGVSNSQEDRQSEYQREIDLLQDQPKDQHIVYFSSLAIFYSNSRYAVHKRTMEKLVKKQFKAYTIIRIGNITWGINPHTLINYFRHAFRTGKPFQVQDVYRYIVDREEFIHWINMIPEWSCEMNIPGRMMKVADIVKIYGNT